MTAPDWDLSTAMRKARLRIRSVRFKNGGEIRLLPSAREEEHKAIMDHLADAIPEIEHRYPNEVAGFALVAWTIHGTAFVQDYYGFGRAEINSYTAPYFVKKTLERLG